MVQAPQVQTLEQIMAELAPSTSKQADIIKKKQANIGVRSAAELAGLDATKANEMNAINTQATGKGLAFSGIPIDEQATYLGEKYLPAVANLKTAQEESNLSLEQQNADLFSQNYKSAYDTLNSQRAAQNQWNLAQMQNEASAAEAERNRQFQASQNAAERAYNSSLKVSEEPTVEETIRAYLESYMNPETGKVAAGAWKNAAAMAKQSGLSFGGEKGFANTFWNYADENNYSYYLGSSYDKYL